MKTSSKKAALPHFLNFRQSHRIALFYRENTKAAYDFSLKIADWLRHHNFEVFTSAEQKALPKCRVLRTRKDMESIAVIIVLGGDGTYLRAVHESKDCAIPIMGINMGSLGFLTKHRIEYAFNLLELMREGKLILKSRRMLSAQVLRNNSSRGDYFALNDVVIERGGYSHLINTVLYCDESFVSEVKADGIIVCSSTGSSAYNLAAGGPILHPDTCALVVTPIAPHSLTSRPFVFPDEAQLCFKIQNKEQKALLVVDGQRALELRKEDQVIIRKSKNLHWMAQDPDYDYFHLLREKLKFGDRS